MATRTCNTFERQLDPPPQFAWEMVTRSSDIWPSEWMGVRDCSSTPMKRFVGAVLGAAGP